jgi:multicomponent Na+:H+ antiporter subunit D
MALAVLPIAIPLLGAAALAAAQHVLPRRVADLVAASLAAATTVLCVLLIFRSAHHDVVHWAGGWKPSHGIALGVAIDVEPLGAGIAALAGTLATAVLVFGWRYFEDAGPLGQAILLAFLAALVGFSLSGDLFNLFVWFELMSVCAFALAAYNIRQPAPLQGGINFAITNTLGALLVLWGIGLLYGRTGALNLDQIGQSIGTRPPDGLVVTSFVLLLVGFLVKAGAVPFHFWLADAYAVAPAPICALFAGVMSDLGLHAIARIYWPVFSGSFAPHAPSVRAILVGVACLTAVVGAAMSFLQRSLKRMLAFVTVAHIGVFLLGIATLSPEGLAGTVVYVGADGLVRGALFLAVAIFVYRLDRGDELQLYGLGRRAPVGALAFCAGALGLAVLPPFGPFLGFTMVGQAADAAGYGWARVVAAVAVAVAAGSLVRAALRITFGIGDRQDPLLTHEPPERSEEPDSEGRMSPPMMLVPTLGLLVLGLGLAFAPELGAHAVAAAERLQARHAHALEVLHEVRPPERPLPSVEIGAGDVLYGLATTLGALSVGFLGLYRRRLPRLAAAALPLRVLKAAHSGVVGDYVAWLTVGAATLGGLFALTLR